MIADNTERKGRGHRNQEATEGGESPTIQRGRAEAIGIKRPQEVGVSLTIQRRRARGYRNQEATVADNTERKDRGYSNREGRIDDNTGVESRGEGSRGERSGGGGGGRNEGRSGPIKS